MARAQLFLSGNDSKKFLERCGRELPIASGITIQTGTAGGAISDSVGTLVVQGVISSQTAGQDISVSASTLNNLGTVKAIGGGTIHVNSRRSLAREYGECRHSVDDLYVISDT